MRKITKKQQYEDTKSFVTSYDGFFFDRVHEVGIADVSDRYNKEYQLIFIGKNSNRHSFTNSLKFGKITIKDDLRVKTLSVAERIAYNALNPTLYPIDRHFMRLNNGIPRRDKREMLLIKHRLTH